MTAAELPHKRGFPPDEGYNRLVDELTEARAEAERLAKEHAALLDCDHSGDGDACGQCVECLGDLIQEAHDQAGWSHAEHVKAVAAIRQSENRPSTEYASFYERVWWKAAQSAVADSQTALTTAEATIAELRAALADASTTPQDSP